MYLSSFSTRQFSVVASNTTFSISPEGLSSIKLTLILFSLPSSKLGSFSSASGVFVKMLSSIATVLGYGRLLWTFLTGLLYSSKSSFSVVCSYIALNMSSQILYYSLIIPGRYSLSFSTLSKAVSYQISLQSSLYQIFLGWIDTFDTHFYLSNRLYNFFLVYSCYFC